MPLNLNDLDGFTPDTATLPGVEKMESDAARAVSESHEGMGKITDLISEATGIALDDLPRNTNVRIAAGVGAVSAATGAVVSTIATGGLAIPALMALGAGAWAAKKVLSELFNDRANRNWLQNRPSGRNGDLANLSGDRAARLGVEASDGLRRAVDHMREVMGPIRRDVSAYHNYYSTQEYSTCEDAINEARSWAAFIHHGDKVRNYLLPAIDLTSFYARQFDGINAAFGRWRSDLDRAIGELIRYHGIDHCGRGGEGLCYGIGAAGASLGSTIGFNNPKYGSAGPWWHFGGQAAPSRPSFEIKAIMDSLNSQAIRIQLDMHESSELSTNYVSVRPLAVGAGPRTNALLDDVWRIVDRPSFFEKGVRRVQHAVSRRTRRELLAAAVSELVGAASAPMSPWVQGAFGDVASMVMFGGETAVTFVAGKVETSEAGAESGDTVREAMRAAVERDFKKAGLTVQELMPQLIYHFGRLAALVDHLAKNPIGWIRNCDQAFQSLRTAAEVEYQMRSVEQLLLQVAVLTDCIAAATIKWSDVEVKAWRGTTERVGAWVEDGAHAHCRQTHKHCYGPLTHHDGSVPNPNQPHKPV